MSAAAPDPAQGAVALLEDEADRVLQARDPAAYAAMEARLGASIAAAGRQPPPGLVWRWAELANRLEEYGVSFERWVRAQQLSPRNDWFATRLIEIGALAGRWEDMLPHVPFLMPRLIARGGTLPDGLRPVLLRFCMATLCGEAGPLRGDRAVLARYLVQAQCLVEMHAAPRRSHYDNLAIELMALQDTDRARFDQAAAQLDAVLFPDGLWPDAPAPAVVLYLTSYRAAPRPDLEAVLREHLPRLGLHHLEQVFARAENLAELPRLRHVAQASLSGVLLMALADARAEPPVPAAELLARLRAGLRLPGETAGRAHEVRFAEDWAARLADDWAASLVADLDAGRSQPAAPAVLATRHRPLAVCIYGQMRGFAAATRSWAGLFGDVEHDVYVSTWRLRGRRDLQPGPNFSDRVLPRALARVHDAMCERHSAHVVRTHFPSLWELLGTSEPLDEAEIRDVWPGARAIRIDEDVDEAFAGLVPQEKMFFRFRAALDLCQASGRGYGQILRIRPDILVQKGTLAPLLRENLATPPGDRLLWSDAAFRFDRRMGFIVGDRVTLGSPEAMAVFAGIWERRMLARPGMSGMEGGLHPHRSLAFHLASHGMQVRRLPVQFGGMLDPPPPAPATLRSAIEADARGRMDEIDRAFLAALDDAAG